MSQIATLKTFVGHQVLKKLARPRRRGRSTSIPDHDQEQELVVGGSDVSYAIVSTAVDYSPPE